MEELKRELAEYTLNDVDDKGGIELGSGSYGVVKIVQLHETRLAAKSFHISSLAAVDHKTLRAFIDECRRSLSLKHDNIVVCHGIYYPQDSSLPSLVMEYLPYCLGKALSIGGIPLQFKPFILADVAKGLYYLHSNNIMHRDLTANNVLLTMSLKAKISDFGQAKMVQPEELRVHTAVPGNWIYMPPEAKCGRNYDFSLDVFSFGVLILHTYLERFPQPADETVPDPYNAHILHQRVPLDYFAHELDMCVHHKSLVRQCLEEVPSRRPSAEKLLTETSYIFYHSLENNSLEIVKNLQSYCTEAEEKLSIHERNEKALQDSLVKATDEMNELVDKYNLMKVDGALIESAEKAYEPDAGRLNLEPDVGRLNLEIDGGRLNLEPDGGRLNLEPDGGRLNLEPDGDRLTHDRCLSPYEPDGVIPSIGGANRSPIHEAEKFSSSKSDVLVASGPIDEKIALHNQLKKLREKNHALKKEIALLESKIKQPPVMISVQNIDAYPPPLTVYGNEDQRSLINDSSTLCVSDVPREPSSFPDIKGAQAVYLQGKVYLGRVTPSIWVYDTETSKWEKLAQDAPVKNYALAIYQEELVLLGGSTYEGKISSEVLVLRNNEWSSQVIPKMNESRENATAVGSGIYLIVFGGFKPSLWSRKIISSIEIYTAEQECFVAIGKNVQRPDNVMQCFIQDGYFYVVYLESRTIQYCAMNNLVCSAEIIWKGVDRNLPYAQSGVFVYDNTLLAISGVNSDGDVYAYDPANKKWKTVNCNGSLPAIENAKCFLISPKKIFICGDSNDIMLSSGSRAMSFLLTVI